jgi:hypothetical protein
MALRTRVVTCDDLDGSEGASRVTFAYDGTSYEIDLREEHRAQLDAVLAKYIAAARRTGPALIRPDRRIRPHPADRRRELQIIRAWARQQGLPISDHGRVPVAVQRAYNAVH